MHLTPLPGLLCAALMFPASHAVAQSNAENAPIKRQILQRETVTARQAEMVMAKVEVAAGARAGWHTHAGQEISYVMEGETWLLLDGEEPKLVKAGESFVVPAGVIHNAKNDSTQVTRLLGIYLIEKGQPLATPATPLKSVP